MPFFSKIARTERIAAREAADLIDDSQTAAANHLIPKEGDIKSYLQARELLAGIGLNQNVPVDYVKSSPYLLSFMRDYKLKRDLERYLRIIPGA